MRQHASRRRSRPNFVGADRFGPVTEDNSLPKMQQMASRRIFSEAFEPSDRIHWAAVIGIVSLSTIAFMNAWRPAGIDDAWITYRYARNIAAGNGYVYNVGERVQGTSTPLYTLLLAAIGLAFGVSSIPMASYLIGWTAFCSTIVLLHKLVAEQYSPAAAWAGTMLIVTFYPMAWISSAGMETPLYALLIFGAFYLYCRSRVDRALLVGALAALMRLEGAIVPGVLLTAFVVKHRRIPWSGTAIAGLLYLAWALFAYFYFGSLLPNSLAAKQSHFANEHYSWWVVTFLKNHYLAVTMATGGGVATLVFNRRLLPLVAWMALYALAYFVSGIRFYPWYVGPLCIGLFVLCAVSFGELLRIGRASRLGQCAIAGAIVMLTLIAANPPPFKPQGYISLADETAIENARYVAARQASIHVRAADTNVSRGIGMVGWFTDCYMIDSAGLVSPWLVHDYPDSYGRDSLESAVARFQPAFVFEALRSVPDVVRENYVEKLRVPSGARSVGPFLLLERKTKSAPSIAERRLP